jgi:hypothetical protein
MTSADVGKDTERMVAGWLRTNGWPGCERRVKTGYRVTGREDPDQGDLTGCPGITWQVKSLRPATRMEQAVPAWLAQAEAQRIASGSDLGFLVVRRWGTTDVGRWWAFSSARQLFTLIGGQPTDLGDDIGRLIPVRMDMAALSSLLHQTGWAGMAPCSGCSMPDGRHWDTCPSRHDGRPTR